MPTSPSPLTHRLSIVYFGTTGRLSAPPLRVLLAAGMNVRAVVLSSLSRGSSASVPAIAALPAAGSRATPMGSSAGRIALPMGTPAAEPNIVRLATEHQIPRFEVAHLAHPRTLATLGDFVPDLICVACFPRRLPPAILALPRLGCLNLHPSLLPANRGPDPLFWTFQRGERVTGVTIHQMDAGLDTGPILAQESVPLHEGIAEAALERELAQHGAALFVGAIEQLANGTAVEMPQDEKRATRFPWPTPDDYIISAAWSARRAYTFACGIRARPQPALVRVDGDRTFAVRAPLGYDEDSRLGAAWRLDGDTLSLQCTSGTFHAWVAPWDG